ncbi:MAG: radical SAM protein [Deltaproteobacteria bacterium]|nr:radical SAM protein [Deltaproteobacteria bacterium]
MNVFGPVPSRRLGQSLGINNIPPKTCSYACIYCQLGHTKKMKTALSEFHNPLELHETVKDSTREIIGKGGHVDYLTFVADGEPTLDANLGQELELLKSLGLKTAVISNSSLIWREDVRKNLMNADWVSLKVDAMQHKIWKTVNRPHGKLDLDAIVDGMIKFSKVFRGELVTETMLINGVNDAEESVSGIANLINRLQPKTAYLSVPTRPPAEKWVQPPTEDALNRAFQIIHERHPQVEYLVGYEGNAFAHTGNVAQDLLSITAVHPMRKDAVNQFLVDAGSEWEDVNMLIREGLLRETEYKGHKFYTRKIHRG